MMSDQTILVTGAAGFIGFHIARRLLAEGRITNDQADRFRREGALGSHLEILERNDGYKGFNQTGISEIITRTDPRRQ